MASRARKREAEPEPETPPTRLRAVREQIRRSVDKAERQRWTCSAIAKAAQIDQGQLSRIENGKARCLPEQAARLVALFPPGTLTEMQLLYPERDVANDVSS